MKKLIVAGLAIAMSLAVFTTKSMAADEIAKPWGVKLGYISSSDWDGSYSVTGEYNLPIYEGLGNIRLMYAPSLGFDQTFGATVVNFDLSYLQLSFNYLWSPAKAEGATGNWYVGGGLGYGTASLDVTCPAIVAAACNAYDGDENSLDINLMAGYKMDNGFSGELLYITDESVWGVNIGYNF